MIKKIKNIFLFITFFTFISLIIFYYFSEKNMINTNKTRSKNNFYVLHNLINIPLLKNDTQNIIEYTDGLEEFKKSKKRYKFFDLLKD
tara:strand:+ start:633 stop:896 length:264 start_codon:yes stop_codon:yes gene_type:complete